MFFTTTLRHTLIVTQEDEIQRFHQYADQYDRKRSVYERLASIAAEMLEAETKSAGIKTHSITSRVKERASFLEKIKRNSYANPFTDTGDLVGLRVVSLFNHDLGAVDRAIRSCFLIIDRDDKEKKTDPRAFEYKSIHYDCYLKRTSVDAADTDLLDIRFEIQSRTILTDAWASIEHYLAYKGKASIPREIVRDLSALNAVLHLADKVFHGIAVDVQAIEVAAAEANPDELQTISLNGATVKGLLRRMLNDREESADREYSELVEQLNRCDYENLEEVRKSIETGLDKAKAFEALSPPFDPMTMESSRFTDVGLAKMAISEADERMHSLLLDFTVDDVDAFLMDNFEGF